jgi:hypothetical protein
MACESEWTHLLLLYLSKQMAEQHFTLPKSVTFEVTRSDAACWGSTTTDK